MWLDKDDLENIAAEYKTAENTIMEKVSHALLPPASTVHLEEIADATYFTNGGNQSYTPLYKLTFRGRPFRFTHLLLYSTYPHRYQVERQSTLLKECMSLRETCDGLDYRQAKVTKGPCFPVCLNSV